MLSTSGATSWDKGDLDLDFDLSDDDNFSVHSASVPNKVTVGI